jgi:hypothetical protein
VRRIASERHCISAGVVMTFTFDFLSGRDAGQRRHEQKCGATAHRHPASNPLSKSALKPFGVPVLAGSRR